jgi:integrase
MRAYMGRRYFQETLGIADDFSDADGEVILSFADAQRRARQQFVIMQRTAKHLDPEPRRGKYTVNECLNDYLETVDNPNIKSTFDVHVRPVLGDIAVQDLTTKILQKWLKDDAAMLPLNLGRHNRFYNPDDPENIRKRKNSANERWFRLLAALNYARKEKGIPSDAWDDMEKFENVHARKQRFFTREEATRLVAAAAVDFGDLLRGALVTGARKSELTGLLVEDFYAENRTVHIVNGKGGRQRHVILNDEGVAVFRRLTNGRQQNEPIFLTSRGTPWSAAAMQRAMRWALHDAGISVPRGTGLHACRHTYCSWALMSGLSPMALAENLGHADTHQIEKVYGHLTRDFVRDTILQHAPTFGF